MFDEILDTRRVSDSSGGFRDNIGTFAGVLDPSADRAAPAVFGAGSLADLTTGAFSSAGGGVISILETSLADVLAAAVFCF